MNFWIHKTIKKVTEDIENFHFNTAIAAIMEFVNYLHKVAPESGLSPSFKEALKTLVVLLFPFVPHFAAELGNSFSPNQDLLSMSWPSFLEAELNKKEIVIVVQVNGKVRAQVMVSPEASQEEVITLVKKNDKIKTYFEGKPIRKEIFVPGKLVSFVV